MSDERVHSVEIIHPFATPALDEHDDPVIDEGPEVLVVVGWNLPVTGTWHEVESHDLGLEPLDVFDLHPELLPEMPDDVSGLDDG